MVLQYPCLLNQFHKTRWQLITSIKSIFSFSSKLWELDWWPEAGERGHRGRLHTGEQSGAKHILIINMIVPPDHPHSGYHVQNFRFLMWWLGKEHQALCQHRSTRSSRSRVASNHTGTHIRSTNSSQFWETTASWPTARAIWTFSVFQVRARQKDQPWSQLQATQQLRAGRWQHHSNCLTCAVSFQPAMTHFIR